MGNRATKQFDRKLDEILRRAAAAFCAQGYHRASIRELSRSTRVSLAGLYYYFRSKEQLLYLIQRHAFEMMLGDARAALERLGDPEERLRTFVRLHVGFFLQHPNEMKVITHEQEPLRDEYRRELEAIKKTYYRLCFDQVEALRRARRLRNLNTRLAALSLFGMMNWIYTWYNPKVDPDAATLAAQMSEIFLGGISGASRSEQGKPAFEAAGARGRGPVAERLTPALLEVRPPTTAGRRPAAVPFQPAPLAWRGRAPQTRRDSTRIS
jgi:AcrR family transcriptional regulator